MYDIFMLNRKYGSYMLPTLYILKTLQLLEVYKDYFKFTKIVKYVRFLLRL